MNNRPIQQIVLLLVILAGCVAYAVPVKAQSKNELRKGLQRGWSDEQVRVWDDYMTKLSKSDFKQISQADCQDFTFRRDALLNGNRITTQITNFGSISSPGNRISDIVWNGLGYGYEFGPFVGAEIVDEGHKDPQSVPQRDQNGNVVKDAQGDTVWVMHIISDGLVSNGGERSPDDTEWWGWQPIPCAQPVGSFEGLQVVEPTSDKLPTSDAPDDNLDGKPDSWPDAWYNENLGEYVWPGALRQGASNADKEALYFMNDYGNKEFAYFPFNDDPTKKGLGLEVEVRLYQWVNPLAEDAIFLIYKITNKSDKDLDKVIFGMWGDPHIGGPDNWPDDLAFFDKNLNMVFAWDDDGRSDIAGRPPGYFGYKFLESPGVGNEIIDGVFYPGDGIDNDGDGMVDESWTDGIDNDGDWNVDRDDVGVDGIDGTGDEGEHDGVPTAGSLFDITKPGEPNFEFTDIDESDQIGLTSFASPPFAGNRVSNDERVWQFVQPGQFDQVPEEPGDYVFLYGSGSFSLRAGQTKRFSIALILGENRRDLALNAETVQEIYNAGYVFAKPPQKPLVTVVPGDKKVSLYWDDRAEKSVDPLTNEQDFEGYVIYRSVAYDFSDQQMITDINGSKFLFRPLETSQGVEAKFDLKNGLTGPAAVPYPRRGVAFDLGDDTGLYHTFVDSNNVINGQRYFYSVVAYDHGSVDLDIPPSETSKIITFNPESERFTFDVNTAVVTPKPRVAGYVPPSIASTGGIQQVSGTGTGSIRIDIIDELAVQNDDPFTIQFSGPPTAYTVIDEKVVSDTITAAVGKSAPLTNRSIVEDGFVLKSTSGQAFARGVDYELNATTGRVAFLSGGSIPQDARVVAEYKHAPVVESTLLNNEEANPVFDGLRIFVDDEVLALNMDETGWSEGGASYGYLVRPATVGPGRVAQPYDYEIRFSDQPIGTSVSTNIPIPFEVFNLTKGNQKIEAFVPDLDRNGQWDLNEQITFFEEIDGSQITTWEVLLQDPDGIGGRPRSGDVFYVRTDKPFTAADRFTFRTAAATADPEKTRNELRDIYVVPNPYVATNPLEPTNPVANDQRGDRRLYFANLPRKATIRIYTLAGELVDTIQHESTLDDGKEFWNLRTKDNMNIAYGLYVFHVESAEGDFIGKFAVIK